MSALPSNPPANAAALDTDAQETREWLEALDAVISAEGPERAHFLLEKLIEEARHNGIDRPFSATTPYINTIEPVDEERSPGNLEIEGRLRAYMRWNAMALVVKANRHDPADGGDLGGHISSFQSVAHLFAAGFNHFWHADDTDKGGTHGGGFGNMDPQKQREISSMGGRAAHQAGHAAAHAGNEGAGAGAGIGRRGVEVPLGDGVGLDGQRCGKGQQE